MDMAAPCFSPASSQRPNLLFAVPAHPFPCLGLRRLLLHTRHGLPASLVRSHTLGDLSNFDFRYPAGASGALDLRSWPKISTYTPPKWNRVLLKVSGEALAGDGKQNIDPQITMAIAREIAAITRFGIQVAIVVGGGNFFRGSAWAGASGLDRATADYIG